MAHMSVASLSDPASALATLGVLIGCLTGLIAIFLTQVENEGRQHALSLATAIAMVVLIPIALIDPLLGVYVAVVLLMILGVGTALAVGAERSISLPKLPSSLRSKPGIKVAVLATSILLPVIAALIVGLLIGGADGDSHPMVTAQPGPYHVANTCFDGVCTVNVCRTPKRCGEGEENVGALKEGTAIEIQCQTLGGMVHGAQHHDRSHIWDRLPSGYYISDLFVEETRVGRFTHKISRCEDA
jgi:hypothetical protein